MGLNITFWNCQGIRSKRKELELYLKENSIDIIALNETFLHKKINFKIKGYDTIRNDRSTDSRGGVAFLVKHGLVVNKEFRNADFNIITDNEALAINLELSCKPKPHFGHHLLPKWKTKFFTFSDHQQSFRQCHVCWRFQLEIRSIWMRLQKRLWSYTQKYPKHT